MNFQSLNNLEKQEIIEVLNQFNLGNKDREVYFALLELGQTTITPLSKTLGFPITTIQSTLQRLSNKGLLNVSMRKSRHTYEAHDPIIFKKILERQTTELNNILPLLNKLKTSDNKNIKIKIYNRERLTDIFHEALKAKNIYEIVSAKDFQNILGEKFHFTKRRVENNVYLKSLRVEEYEIKKYNKKIHEKELREAKFLPRELTFKSSIMFWDNTITFFTTKDEGLAWTVQSATMTEMIKQIFELLWSISRKMETLDH